MRISTLTFSGTADRRAQCDELVALAHVVLAADSKVNMEPFVNRYLCRQLGDAAVNLLVAASHQRPYATKHVRAETHDDPPALAEAETVDADLRLLLSLGLVRAYVFFDKNEGDLRQLVEITPIGFVLAHWF